MSEDQGASPDGDRAAREPSPSVSALRASIPSAGDWVVYRGWGIELGEVAKVTPRLVKFKGTRWPHQVEHSKVIALFSDKAEAERFKRAIKGEFRRRRDAAEAADRAIEKLVASAQPQPPTTENQ